MAKRPPADGVIETVLRQAVADHLKTEGMTRYRIAKDAGMPQSTLDQWLNGQRDIRLRTADRIAATVGLKLKAVRHDN